MKFRFIRKKCKTVEDWEEEIKDFRMRSAFLMLFGAIFIISFLFSSEVLMGVLSGMFFAFSSLCYAMSIRAEFKVIELKLKEMIE